MLECQGRPCDIAAIGPRQNQSSIRLSPSYTFIETHPIVAIRDCCNSQLLQYRGPEAVLPNQGPEAGQHADGRAAAALPEDLRLWLRAPLRPEAQRPEAQPRPLQVAHRVHSCSCYVPDHLMHALAWPDVQILHAQLVQP